MRPEETDAFDADFETNDTASQADESDASSLDYDQAMEQAFSDPTGAPQSSLQQQLSESQREVLRSRAELENFRKRTLRDTELQLKYANMPLLRELLDVVDNLRRAAEAAQEEGANTDALRQGVTMVIQQFETVLAKYGCRPIDALGAEFDPNVHEAIAQMASEEHDVGKVSQEVTVGYVLHDRVVRPSNVIVSTGSSTANNQQPE